MDVQRSPTVNQLSVMILLSIAATARCDILTGDIKGAYLYTSIKEDKPWRIFSAKWALSIDSIEGMMDGYSYN
jgi:hypothetical protein